MTASTVFQIPVGCGSDSAAPEHIISSLQSLSAASPQHHEIVSLNSNNQVIHVKINRQMQDKTKSFEHFKIKMYKKMW